MSKQSLRSSNSSRVLTVCVQSWMEIDCQFQIRIIVSKGVEQRDLSAADEDRLGWKKRESNRVETRIREKEKDGQTMRAWLMGSLFIRFRLGHNVPGVCGVEFLHSAPTTRTNSGWNPGGGRIEEDLATKPFLLLTVSSPLRSLWIQFPADFAILLRRLIRVLCSVPVARTLSRARENRLKYTSHEEGSMTRKIRWLISTSIPPIPMQLQGCERRSTLSRRTWRNGSNKAASL